MGDNELYQLPFSIMNKLSFGRIMSLLLFSRKRGLYIRGIVIVRHRANA